jgi:adenylylsulfate kinase-like enzyme
MTGIDDLYEPPQRRELELNGAEFGVEQLVERVTTYLGKIGLLKA